MPVSPVEDRPGLSRRRFSHSDSYRLCAPVSVASAVATSHEPAIYDSYHGTMSDRERLRRGLPDQQDTEAGVT